ncbi:transposable element Tc1 transposase [Trichonephila clavipes]|nr:transposable element Tc1 transposase [Trichonephila clavipes]
MVRRNRETIVSQLSRYLYADTGTHASIVTVPKRLHERGLLSRKHAVCVPLTSKNRRVHLAWGRQHTDWSMDQWVTDESRFCLNTDSCRTFIWREPGTCYLPSYVREIDKYGRGGLMVWTGIMLNGHTPLLVFERGSVIGVMYMDEVLTLCLPFQIACGPEFILMDDNVLADKALHVDEYLEGEDIRRMDCPARRSDFKPIGQVGDSLGRSIATRNSHSANHPGNENIVVEQVGTIATQDMINCLISNMTLI